MPRQATPNLSNTVEAFLRIKTRQSGSPHRALLAYRSTLGRFVRSVSDIHVGSLRPAHVEDFFYGPGGLSESCSPETITGYKNHVKQWLDFCHRRGWTEHTGDYMVGGVAEKSTKRNRERFRMSRRELLDLMDAADDPRDRALVAFAINTACRIGEAATVRIKDLRLDRGEVYLRRHKTRQEVTLPLTADLDRELRAWLTRYAELAGQGLSPDFYLFPTKHRKLFVRGGVPGVIEMHPDGPYNPPVKFCNPRDIILPIAARAGVELEPGDGWHTIRRSVARIFFDAASDAGHDRALRLTQALLGHASSKTTEVYLGLQVENQQVTKLLKGQPFIDKGLENVIRLDRKAS